MKVLFIISNTHHKNANFIFKCKIINFITINSVNELNNLNIDDFDAVISPCDAINVSKYPNTKFIFGPHFSVFPNDNLKIIKGPKTAYNLLSNWVVEFWKPFPICNDLNFVKLPFGVDTNKFCENKQSTEKTDVMIYFKHRNPTELNFITNFLNSKNINYSIFSYNKRYNEDDYINCLQKSKFCIWVSGHESQGFALQEALSCNVPLLVWNVTSMNQEYGYAYDNIPATTTPYWDNICGERFYKESELENTFDKLIQNINNYNPRKFILENLSIEICEERLINFINSM